ncbi:MAG: serine protease [Alphaproteobacteria bacterium]|nr:serine protease [Alphaproteobacteria bacterium]
MQVFLRLFCVLFAFYASANGAAAVPLTAANINARIGNLLSNPAVADANECFEFREFIENSTNPATGPARIAAITRLRALLNSNVFADNVEPYLKNTDFLSNRLLKLEIKHENPNNNLDINHRTEHITNMMVRIETPKGSASGILIPVPDRFNAGGMPHHSWAILTCGHILDDVSIEKKTFGGIPENFNAHLNTLPVGILNPIPIHSIKVFKTNSFRLENKNGFAYEGFGDNILNAQDIRAIPRYEYPGDFALCYLHLTLAQIQAINQEFLAAPVGGVYPNIHVAAHQISFQGRNRGHGEFTYNFKFIRDVPTRDAYVGEINAAAPDHGRKGFVLGYVENPALLGNYVLTLSTSRAGGTQIYGGDFIDPTGVAARPENEFMFFHDAPTYSGMSGGPVFNTPGDVAHANEINIFGVVQAYNSPDLPPLPNPPPPNPELQSRCSASFLMESILN